LKKPRLELSFKTLNVAPATSSSCSSAVSNAEDSDTVDFGNDFDIDDWSDDGSEEFNNENRSPSPKKRSWQ
jgi:hypothetical protein